MDAELLTRFPVESGGVGAKTHTPPDRRVVTEMACERHRDTQLLKEKNRELSTMTRKLEEKVRTLEKKSREVSEQQLERSRRIVRKLPQARAVPTEQDTPQRSIAAQQRGPPHQRALSPQKKTVTWQLRPSQQQDRCARAVNGTAHRQQSGLQRTVSGTQTARGAPPSPQRSVRSAPSPQRGSPSHVNGGGGGGERIVIKSGLREGSNERTLSKSGSRERSGERTLPKAASREGSKERTLSRLECKDASTERTSSKIVNGSQDKTIHKTKSSSSRRTLPKLNMKGANSGEKTVASSGEKTEPSSGEKPGQKGLAQRTTLTAKQREREAEYQRQIKERDSEIKKLRDRMKVISDRLSKKNELQLLKEKGKKELLNIIVQLQREKTKLEQQLHLLAEEQRSQHESDVEKFKSLEEENGTLLEQLNEVNKLLQDHKEIQTQFEEKIEECEQLADNLHKKNDLCDDLEKQLTRVIEKNTELTIQNSDLHRQINELDDISQQCAVLKESLNCVGSEYESAKFEVQILRDKVSTLESVLKQMRDAAERKQELERQHQEAQNELRLKQEQIQKLTKISEEDRQASDDTIQTLESKIRELEKKAEVQSLRHEELMLEMSSLKKQSKYKMDGSPEGTITPDSMLLSNNSTARSTPVGTVITPASLDALPEVDETQWLSGVQSSSAGAPVLLTPALQLPTSFSSAAAGDAQLPMASFASYQPVPTAYNVLPAQLASVFPDTKTTMVNGSVPGLIPVTVAHPGHQLAMGHHISAQQLTAAQQQLTAAQQQLTTPVQPGVVDALDIPGKGKCQVFIARYSYDPFQQSPNEAPESELRLNAGDYVLVWGVMDEDGFLDGETLDGRRGLVPSNFVQKLVGEDLLEFHRQAVAGLRDADQTSVSTALPHELEFNSVDDAYLNNLDDAGMRPLAPDQVAYPGVPVPAQYPVYGYAPSILSDEEEDETGAGAGQRAVAPPRQLTLERQLNKSVLIGWSAPEHAPAEPVDCYHVYVDGMLRTTVQATERTCALIEAVDSHRPHRISVRTVTPNRRTSRDAACTMLIGKDVPLAPTAVRATNVTSTSAVISWMPSNSNFQHTVCVNSVEVRTVKPGVYRHTITGISPNTTYRVSVKVKNITAPQFANRTPKQQERLATHIEFRTLPRGVPDPPVDVQCELGPQEGSVLVTWLPVTINSTSGTSNGAPVTGYAVYADGKKITEVGSPTGDHALVDLNCIHGLNPRQLTVRTKSRDLVSADSVPCPVPSRNQRKHSPEESDSVPHTPADPELYQILRNTADILTRPPPTYSSQFTDYETDELSDIPEEAEESDLSEDEDQQMESPRHRQPQLQNQQQQQFQQQQQQQQQGSPQAARRRTPLSAAPPRGQSHSQQVLETDENLSDREIYPSGYMAIPQIEITKDSASEGRGSVELSEEDTDLRGPRGRRRVLGDRGRAVPPHDPRGPPRHRQDEFRDNAGYQTGYRQGDGGGPSGPPLPRRVPQQPTTSREERMRIFVALFDYDPPTMSPNPDACHEELPFREGQLIKIYGEKDGDGFYWGEASGRAGYVPCNMVSEVQVDDERLAQELLKDEDRQPARPRAGGGPSNQGGGGGGGRARGQEDRWGDIYASTPVRRMVALYDYDPQELSPNVDAEVELSFNTGDIIYIYGDMDDDGFYIGEVNGVRGLVPSNFLTETPQNYDRRRGPDGPGAAERRAPPGPGVHGPPLPPRDKGDSRDRRKDPPHMQLEFRPELQREPDPERVSESLTSGPSQPESTPATAVGDASAGSQPRLPNGAPPSLAQPPPPTADTKPSLLGGLGSIGATGGGFIKGLGGGLANAKVPSFIIPNSANGGAATGPAGAAAATAPAVGNDPAPQPQPNLMQKLGGMTGDAGGAVEGIMSKGKELIFKRFGL